MHLPEFAPCPECGLFHGLADRAVHQPIHQRLRNSNVSEFEGDTSNLYTGAVFLDRDGDIWHFSRNDDGDDAWDCQATEAQFTCKQYETFLLQATAPYPDGYKPHYLVSDGKPNIPVPSFTSVEEAEAWLEANA